MKSTTQRACRRSTTLKAILSFACLVAPMVVTTIVEAAPEINIGEHFDYLQAGKTNFLKRIRNTGDSTAFVEVSIFELIFDEKTGETREAEPAAVSMGLGAAQQTKGTLVASPRRLIIPAGGAQSTRLVFLGPRDKERYYRVRFAPVAAQKGSDAAAGTKLEDQAEELSAGVTMMVGYGAIFTVRPDHPVYDTRISETGDTHRFINFGNSTVVLHDIYRCESANKNCQSLGSKRIRPGRMTELAKSPTHSYTFELVEGEHTKPTDLRGAE